MNIRKATKKDFSNLYSFALTFPELQVSATEPFMRSEEFKDALTDPESVMLVAEEKEFIGFVHARIRDIDRPSTQTACIVYLAVDKKYRKKGVATQLFNECVKELKAKGISYVFTWANDESPIIKKFMKKQGFIEGHTYTWMDKKI